MYSVDLYGSLKSNDCPVLLTADWFLVHAHAQTTVAVTRSHRLSRQLRGLHLQKAAAESALKWT